MRGDRQTPLNHQGVTESQLRGDTQSPEGCLRVTQSIYEVDTKTLRRPPAYGRPASLQEHERLAEWIVSWACLVAEPLSDYKRNRSSVWGER